MAPLLDPSHLFSVYSTTSKYQPFMYRPYPCLLPRTYHTSCRFKTSNSVFQPLGTFDLQRQASAGHALKHGFILVASRDTLEQPQLFIHWSTASSSSRPSSLKTRPVPMLRSLSHYQPSYLSSTSLPIPFHTFAAR